MPSSQVMPKFKRGKLHSGSKHGPVVTNPAQARAIAASEARAEKEGKGHAARGERIHKAQEKRNRS
jgi:hypothetical protein